jgi:hypothetical protein
MAMNANPLVGTIRINESSGRLPWQGTARGKRPFLNEWRFCACQGVSYVTQARRLRLSKGGSKLQSVRRVSAIGLALLVVSWIALPAVACMLPGQGMTAAEHACCKKMPKMCGSAHMPRSHSCCQKEVQSGGTLIVATSHHFAVTLEGIAALPALYPPSPSLALSSLTQDSPSADSPPGSAVLRI